jgi:hypothetical protein
MNFKSRDLSSPSQGYAGGNAWTDHLTFSSYIKKKNSFWLMKVSGLHHPSIPWAITGCSSGTRIEDIDIVRPYLVHIATVSPY